MATHPPSTQDPTVSPIPLRLSDAKLLLQHPYLALEAGHGLTTDNMVHVAASTYMPGVTAAMIDWWFGFIHNTEQYKLWHPRDHVFSDWEGPRENRSEYIGGHHLVHEFIGTGELKKLKISFRDPGVYFGVGWEGEFEKGGYGTAVCGRVGRWEEEKETEAGEYGKKVVYTGHLIHLVKNEPDGCRMRSRFWLGDVEGLPQAMGDKIPEEDATGLLKHATEEMAILAAKLPELYRKFSRKEGSL